MQYWDQERIEHYIREQFSAWSGWHFAFDGALTLVITKVAVVLGDLGWYDTITFGLLVCLLITAAMGLWLRRSSPNEFSEKDADAAERRDHVARRSNASSQLIQRLQQYASDVPFGDISKYGAWRAMVAADLQGSCREKLVANFNNAASDTTNPQIAQAYLRSLATNLSVWDMRHAGE